MSIAHLLFSFDGRLNRSQFWLGMIIVLGAMLALFWLGTLLLDATVSWHLMVFLVVLLALWPSLAVQTKRWHDRNKSAAWILLAQVPIVGIWAWIECGFLRGTKGRNRFGDEPLPLGEDHPRQAETAQSDHPLIRHDQALQWAAMDLDPLRSMSRQKAGKEEVEVPHAPRPRTQKLLRDASTDDWYEAISEELDSGRTLKGLWTKCYAECDGDEKQTRLRYIRERIRQFETAQVELHETQRKAEEEDRQRQQRLADAGMAQLDENDCLQILGSAGYTAHRRMNTLSDGAIWHINTPAGHRIISSSLDDMKYLAISARDEEVEVLATPTLAANCPACHGKVRRDAKLCRHCGASFGEGSAWTPLQRRD